MTVENYIRDLLYRYECVIVSGFGAFITQRKPAEIHASTNAFYPPKKSISFNGQLKQSDGLLADYISKTEKISFDAAMAKIRQFTGQLEKMLSEEKEINLDLIGIFHKKNDKLEFQPSYHSNYLLDSFGMASFTSLEITRALRQAQDTKKEVVVLEETFAKATVSKEKTGLVFTHEKKLSKKHAYLKYAAIGLLALGVSGFLGLNWYSNQVETHNIAAQQQAEAELENKIQQATFIINPPLQEIVFEVKSQPGNYHIVAGAFRDEANAVKKTHQLKQKGFSARKIGANKWGLHQVVYSSYETRREALKALYKIRQTDNENAWLLVQEL